MNEHYTAGATALCCEPGLDEGYLGYQAGSEMKHGLLLRPFLSVTAMSVPDLSGAQAAAQIRPQKILVSPGILLLLRRQAPHPPPLHAACMPQKSLNGDMLIAPWTRETTAIPHKKHPTTFSYCFHYHVMQLCKAKGTCFTHPATVTVKIKAEAPSSLVSATSRLR